MPVWEWEEVQEVLWGGISPHDFGSLLGSAEVDSGSWPPDGLRRGVRRRSPPPGMTHGRAVSGIKGHQAVGGALHRKWLHAGPNYLTPEDLLVGQAREAA